MTEWITWTIVGLVSIPGWIFLFITAGWYPTFSKRKIARLRILVVCIAASQIATWFHLIPNQLDQPLFFSFMVGYVIYYVFIDDDDDDGPGLLALTKLKMKEFLAHGVPARRPMPT